MPAAPSTTIFHQIPIELGDRSYPISIGQSLLGHAATRSAVPASDQALIVSNTTVAPLYAAQLAGAVGERHRRVHQLALPDGENHKTWTTLQLIFDELLRNAC